MSNPAAIHQKVMEKMESALEYLKRDLAGLRTGRASVALFDGVRVDYYGTMTPLKQVANISTPEARLITIQPWEPNLIKEIEKALAGSNLGVTPSNDGKIIRIPLPPLTEERRKELGKVCKKHGEDTKVVVRGFRRDGNEELKKLQKDAKLTEDDLRKAEADTQKLTDQYIQKVDDVVKKKNKKSWKCDCGFDLATHLRHSQSLGTRPQSLVHPRLSLSRLRGHGHRQGQRLWAWSR